MKTMGKTRLAVILIVGELFATGQWALPAGQEADVALRSEVDRRLHVTRGGGTVCSVAILDFTGDRSYSILATIDWSGRGFCNDLRVLSTASRAVTDRQFDVWNVRNVKNLIVTLGTSGEKQLAIPRPYSSYNGSRCVATWTAILRKQDDKLVDASADFRSFYEDRLKALQDRLVHGEAEPECTQMEADKARRFLGISPTAGFAQAKGWIHSADASLRAKGVAVLGDIGDDASRRELKIVASGDTLEAVMAKHYLETASGR